MAVSVQENKAPAIDLPALHTPYKLAAFVVNVPTRKQEYSFLFNEDNNHNNNNNLMTPNNQSQLHFNNNPQNKSFLNANNTHFLNVHSKSSTNIKKSKSKSSKKKKKRKSKANKKAKHQSHLNPDEQDMPEMYQADHIGPNPAINDQGFSYMDDYDKSHRNLPEAPLSPSSKANSFEKSKQSKQVQRSPQPKLPQNDNQNNEGDLSSVAQQKQSSFKNADELQSHHHKSSLLNDDNNEQSSFNSLPNIDDNLPIPAPIEPILPSRFEHDTLPQAETFDAKSFQVSIVDTPTIDNIDMPEMVPLDAVQLSGAESGFSEDDMMSPPVHQFQNRRMLSVNINEPNRDPMDSRNDLSKFDESDTDDYGDDEEQEEEEEDDDEDTTDESTDDDDGIGYGMGGSIGDLIPQEEEKNICVRIAKVLYDNSWTGEMISNSAEFSRREYNALLDVGNVPTDSYISNLVWKIIFYSQKKTEDDLINEDKPHIKWFWWDSNDIDSDWKWRKYNVIICQWITDEYQLFLDTIYDDKDKHNKKLHKEIPFSECQQKLEKEHEKNSKKHQRNQPQKDNDDDDDDDGKDDEKSGYIKNNNNDDDDDEDDNKNGNKKKKITIDAYFDKNSNYTHWLRIERDELDESNILIWHKIVKKTDNIEYFREIRLGHKLFDIKQEMIINNYQPNPSPFAIPPQLAAVDS